MFPLKKFVKNFIAVLTKKIIHAKHPKMSFNDSSHPLSLSFEATSNFNCSLL